MNEWIKLTSLILLQEVTDLHSTIQNIDKISADPEYFSGPTDQFIQVEIMPAKFMVIWHSTP